MRLVIIIIFFVNYATSKTVPGIGQKLSYQNTGTFNLIENAVGSLQIPADSTHDSCSILKISVLYHFIMKQWQCNDENKAE